MKPLGLVGVALGTLMPIAAVSGLVIFPVACQRVDVSVPSALRHAVWPALWPALVMTACLVLTRRFSSGTLLAVMLEAGGAGLLYLALFFLIAVGRRDRSQYAAKFMEVVARRGRLAPAA